MATDTEKLSQIVEFLAQVRTVLDGGWHYSSPLIRTQGSVSQMLVERSDALGIFADVTADIGLVSDSLFSLASRASELGVDTVSLCGADLGLFARVYQQLAHDMSTAANRAIEALSPAPKAERRPRAPRIPKSSAPSSPQTSLLVEPDPEPTHELEPELSSDTLGILP